MNINADEVARTMFVSPRSVYRYSERFLLTGDVKRFAKKNGPTRKLGEYEEFFLAELVLSKPGIYLLTRDPGRTVF